MPSSEAACGAVLFSLDMGANQAFAAALDEREQGETHAGLRVGGRSIARLGRGVTASVHYIPPCTCYGGRVDLRCPHHGEGPQ